MVATDETYIHTLAEETAVDIERRIALEEGEEVDIPPETVPIDARIAAGPQLSVLLLDLYPKENAKKHRTDRFELVKGKLSTPVLRRALPFLAAAKFNRKMDKSKDKINLVLSFGPTPDFAKGTQVNIPVEEASELKLTDKWRARFHSENGDNVTFEIISPPNALVGEWKWRIQTICVDDPSDKKLSTIEKKFYLLFNPWCSRDGVHMKSEEDLDEYVLNDSGKVWVGVWNSFCGRPWMFGQFDISVLPSVILLLNCSGLPHNKWGNPVLVARALSLASNNTIRGGLLEGNWSNKYKGGVKPTDWTGSVGIFEKYAKSRGQTVKFGQCWVYSACIVTACRALGIPARSVTNFSSGHDTNRNLCIDKYFKKDGKDIKGGPRGDSTDSVWNFHVWADVWMSRPDLPIGYGGWQVIDATPQEASPHSGFYECGPCPVTAVKNGEIGLTYDAPFVYAEVNADMVRYIEDKEHPLGFKKASADTREIGIKIVTKCPNKYDPEYDSDVEDITDEYKYEEGTSQERQAMQRAYKCMNITLPALAPPAFEEHLQFKLADSDRVSLGQDVKISLNIKNVWTKALTVVINLVASSVGYDGKFSQEISEEHETVTIDKSKSDTLQMVIPASDYLGKLSDMGFIKVNCLCIVNETGQTWSGGLDIHIHKPVITVQVSGNLKVGQPSQAQFSFPNPIDAALTECHFSVEGHGLQRPKIYPFRDVKPREMVKFTTEFKPRLSGSLTYVVSFDSTQLAGVTGSIRLQVDE